MVVMCDIEIAKYLFLDVVDNIFTFVITIHEKYEGNWTVKCEKTVFQGCRMLVVDSL